MVRDSGCLLLLFGRVRLLQGRRRTVSSVVDVLQRNGCDARRRSCAAADAATGRSERTVSHRIERILSGMVHGLGARRRRVEERLRKLPLAPGHLLRLPRVGFENAVEEGLQIRLGLLIEIQHVLVGPVLVGRHLRRLRCARGTSESVLRGQYTSLVQKHLPNPTLVQF